MKWVKWKDQDELSNLIQYNIDTGSGKHYIAENIIRDSKGKYTQEEIFNKISELSNKKLIVGEEEDWIRVTEWASDGVMTIKKDATYEECLQILKAHGVYHPRMLQNGVITKIEQEEYDKQS
jgi:hypothetical protein